MKLKYIITNNMPNTFCGKGGGRVKKVIWILTFTNCFIYILNKTCHLFLYTHQMSQVISILLTKMQNNSSKFLR